MTKETNFDNSEYKYNAVNTIGFSGVTNPTQLFKTITDDKMK